ncbi:dihydrofolate reductase family protein [Lewinella sp. W8]|uniref:dihydrofolate reductase family protein n=1 Tax=Lewinella sp. W8 TaxID=2528208 RepID=UPI001068A278|nr:dihydrofolate reductase family protein [Lewinella sp. W8]MTB52365.1 dihydrofolate reductase [Lewinella sp. W8]
MKKIIYYVATSLDGYIAGKNEDISQFVQRGDGVDKYLADLANFSTVIMGRKTYEFGYQFGLQPGQPAYPHMQHHIFSRSLNLADKADSVSIEKLSVDRIQEIREASPTDVYLCGGGEFAGWLLDHGLIDQLKIKLNPIVLGVGTRLFGNSTTAESWDLADRESFSDGLQILTYRRR